MEPVLIHTHFHKRRTGVTRSIENVLPFFNSQYETYVYGYGINGKKISFLELKSLLFSKREVVVHCHRNNEIMHMLWFRFFGAKFTLIATRHAESTPSKLTSFLLKKSDKVVTLIHSMGKNLGINNSVVAHGVDIDFFKPKAGVRLPNILQEHIILCAGRVRKAKGQKVLLEAAIPLLKKHNDWALVVVGKVDKPPFIEDLNALVKENNIENQVYFIDETLDILSYYQASKIAVVPSFSEGFSLVCAEAMSCACSVIATKHVGVHSDIISDSENGYLFDPGNVNALRELLSKKMTGALPLLGTQARETIIKAWSSKKEAENLMDFYKN